MAQTGVFEYLNNKYGSNRVCHLGTISRYKARSAISEVCKDIKMPLPDIKSLKENIIEKNPKKIELTLFFQLFNTVWK